MLEQSRAHRKWCDGVRRLGYAVEGTTNQRDLDRATQHFRQALELDPGLVDAYLGLILAGGDFDESVMAAMAAPDRWGEARARSKVALESRFDVDGIFTQRLMTGEELYLAAASVQIRQHDLAHADRILAACPDTGMFNAARAYLYSGAERHVEVLSFAGRVNMDNLHYFASAMVYASRAALALGLTDEAIRRTTWLLDHGTLSDEFFRYSRLMHAYAFRQAGDEDTARAQFQRIYAEDPSFHGIDHALSGASWPRHDPETVALRTDPWDPGSVPPPDESDALSPEEAVADAMAELRAMPGMSAVEEQVDRLVARVTGALRRGESISGAPHMIFTGPPGTGKTSVARIVARVYHALGLLSTDTVVEAARVDFVGQHLGTTAIKTNALVDSAMGGVLLIDEAYALVRDGGIDGGDNFGQEAVATLLKRIEDDRGDLVVILAGYAGEMDRFLESNDGLRSRFGRKVAFPTYSADALQQIAQAMAASHGDKFEDEALKVSAAAFGHVDSARLTDRLGNGRFVRNLLDHARESRDVRLAGDPDAQGDAALTAADIRAAALAFGVPAGVVGGASATDSTQDVGAILAELDAMPGMDGVHTQVKRLVARVQMAQRRGEAVSGGSHLLFVGPPGTGKTTVARTVARLYHALGLLGTEEVVEATRSDFVGQSVGSSALKTDKLIDSALGGVLFIDEAYALVGNSATGGDDFGLEAVATLLKRMEDDRGQLVVIAAGYPQEMDAFLESNSGLRSRFSRRVAFDSYDADTLHTIAEQMADTQGATWTEDALDELRTITKAACDSGQVDRLGNARFVRNLIDHALEARDVRLFDSAAEDTDLSAISGEDLQEAASALQVPSA